MMMQCYGYLAGIRISYERSAIMRMRIPIPTPISILIPISIPIPINHPYQRPNLNAPQLSSIALTPEMSRSPTIFFNNIISKIINHSLLTYSAHTYTDTYIHTYIYTYICTDICTDIHDTVHRQNASSKPDLAPQSSHDVSTNPVIHGVFHV